MSIKSIMVFTNSIFHFLKWCLSSRIKEGKFGTASLELKQSSKLTHHNTTKDSIKKTHSAPIKIIYHNTYNERINKNVIIISYHKYKRLSIFL